MKHYSILIANYSQTGSHEFPEDTWKTSKQIQSADDFWDWCKFLRMQSSSGFSSFPCGDGLFSFNNFTFTKQDCIEIDGVEYKAKQYETERPEYFDVVAYNFKKLTERHDRCYKIWETIRGRRKAEERERITFEALRAKYETE